MKMIIACILMFSVSLVSFSQQTNPLPDLIKQDYLLKSKKQKTAAWLLLGGGAFVGASGYVLFIYEGLEGDGVRSVKATLDLVLFFGGAAAMISSIPLFISSANSKLRGMNLTFKKETLTLVQTGSLINHSFPSLALKIGL